MQNIEFDKRVKEIMDGHLEVPAQDSWEKLVLELDRKRARVLYFRRGVYATAAIAASLLLFLIIGKEGPVPATLQNTQTISVLSQNIPAPVVSGQNKSENGKSIMKSVKSINSVKKAKAKEVVQETLIAQVVQQEAKDSGKPAEKKEKRPDKSVAENQTNNYYNFENEPVGKRSFTKRLMYAFSTNLSPSLYNKSINMLSVSLGYQNDFVPTSLKETIRPQSISNTRYSMPLAFGFQAQLPINKKFSVGAGLNYSLLVSQFQNLEINSRRDIQQSLHYIGIPVNAYYTFLQNNQLKVYVAAGFVLEKGIVENDRIVENGVKSIENYSIPGVQFSLSGGIGIEFLLNKELGLYFDPAVAYYFKGNQPDNIRTAQPLQYKVELGMRFHM